MLEGTGFALQYQQGGILEKADFFVFSFILEDLGFSGGKESAWDAGDLGSVPGVGRAPGEGNGYPFQYSELENSMDYSPCSRKELDMTVRLSLSLYAKNKTGKATFY